MEVLDELIDDLDDYLRIEQDKFETENKNY